MNRQFIDHNGRTLTILSVTGSLIEYMRQGESVSRVCLLEWFVAEKYQAVTA